jgi:hypothetical protein
LDDKGKKRNMGKNNGIPPTSDKKMPGISRKQG